MREGMKTFWTVAGMTALLGWLPTLLSIWAMQVALEHGARSWPDAVCYVVFGGLYLALLGAGAWVFASWFRD